MKIKWMSIQRHINDQRIPKDLSEQGLTKHFSKTEQQTKKSEAEMFLSSNKT
jgi:hypothetical protein